MQDDNRETKNTIEEFIEMNKRIKKTNITKCPYWDSDNGCWNCLRFNNNVGTKKENCPFHKDQTYESQKKAIWLMDKILLNTEFGKLTKEISKISKPIKDLAEFMHKAYLELAIKHDWKVQYNTDCPFADLPLSNQAIMFELASKIYEYMSC